MLTKTAVYGAQLSVDTRTANSNLSSNSKILGGLAELELEKIMFLNPIKTVGVDKNEIYLKNKKLWDTKIFFVDHAM